MKKIIDLLKEIHPNYDYENSQDYITDGLLDSFDLMRLIMAIGNEYGVTIAGTDLMPDNFSSAKEIADLLKDYGVEDVL